MNRRFAAMVGVLALVGCEAEPGACIESVRVSSVRHGWCYQVDGGGRCPTFESGDEAGEFEWEFAAGERCEDLGYPFACGDGVFEDIESECSSAE